MPVFRAKYGSFKNLLESNAELLKIIGGIEERLEGHQAFGTPYIRAQMPRVLFHTARMIRSLEELAGRPYPALNAVLDRLQESIKEELELEPPPRLPDYVLPFTRIHRTMVDFVGGKNANLGEIKNRVGLPIPYGFAITTTAYDELIEYNDLPDDLRRLQEDFDAADPESCVRISKAIARMFRDAEVPPAIAQAISGAYRQQISPDASIAVALRSSAVGEDSELSFAGQYVTVLNVPPADITEQYKTVIAGLFTPRAISYRFRKGISFEESAMSVACLEMVDATAAGVMYTRHPFEAGRDNILINAAWGLGTRVVDGVGAVDTFELSKSDPPALTASKTGIKPIRPALAAGGYTAETVVDEPLRDKPCITAAQAVHLAVCGLKLEGHFGQPQDVEWAIDRNGKVLFLQSRPLRIKGRPMPVVSRQPEGYNVLLEGGSIACPGVGCGPAHIIHEENDLFGFPDGGVLVAAHPSSQFVMVMEKARAIVTNSGSITGHMASLAREFKLPTLLNTHRATTAIPEGRVITVDAFSGRVYEGEVPDLLALQESPGPFMKDTAVYRSLQKLSQMIVPLNLTNPKSRRFSPKYCQTVHDIMRFTHELAYGEIFRLSDFTADRGKISVRLEAPLPIDLHVIDLGGGLAGDGKGKTARPEQVRSAPFSALLAGMLHEDLKPFEPRPVHLRGFLSVMSEQMLSPPNPVVERFGDKSYAIISDKYLNFSSRVGYHYSILDSYCGQTTEKNYINFQFSGGAADRVRRNRRARLIQRVLGISGFLVEVEGDRVTARFGKQEPAVIAEKLQLLGRLLIFTRQMDMLMNHEQSVGALADRFLQGRYDLDRTEAFEKNQ